MASRAFIGLGALCAFVATGANPAWAQVLKPALSVRDADGRLSGYSAALPLDLSTSSDKAMLTAKVAGNLDEPTYGLDFKFDGKADPYLPADRTFAMGATWNPHQAVLRSSMTRLVGFGLAPRSNFVQFAVDLNAEQPITLPERDIRARANLRSTLVLEGQRVGSVAVGGGDLGDQVVDLTLNRPFDLQADFALSLRGDDEAWRESRVMVTLVKAGW